MVGQRRLEQQGVDPFEALLVVGGVLLMDRLCASQGVGPHVNVSGCFHQPVEQVLRIAFEAVSVFVDALSIQQAGIQHTRRQVEPVLDRVEVDAVAKNVAVDGLKERKARRLKPLEQVCLAKAHQAFAGSTEVLDQLAFGRRGILFGHRVHVVAWQLPSVGWPAKGSSRCGVKMRTR